MSDMTYFVFLILFLLLPIVALVAWLILSSSRHQPDTKLLGAGSFRLIVLIHVFVAVIYTTPWDNYLVATRVWWYDPALVSGMVIGWVPIEEYTFFVLQPILAGLWLFFLGRHFKASKAPLRSSLRFWSVAAMLPIWVAGLLILVVGWQPGNYLALELVWALPPIALQLGFGADILWRYRRLVLFNILSLTVYLSAADALAINWGTWTINPEKSLGILVAGVLPVEELLFFLLTNMLITFGVVLMLARESYARVPSGWALTRVIGIKEKRAYE